MKFTKLSLLASVCLLAACANIEETSIQPITVETPGAAESRCYLTIDGFRYPVTPPQSLNISKSDKDLLVECFASGNRHQTQIIHPVMSKYGQAEAVTGNVPGLAWDFWSDSLYKYPDVITVDFSHAPTTIDGLPAQNTTDVRQPEEYNLEEKVGGWPQRVSDKYAKPFPLYPREKESSDDGQMIQTGGNSPGKGDLQPAAPKAAASTSTPPAAVPATAVAAPVPATTGKTGMRTMPPSPHAADLPVSTQGAPNPIPSTPQPAAPSSAAAGGSSTPMPTTPATSAPPQGPSEQGAAGPAPPPPASGNSTMDNGAPDSSVFVNPDAPASGPPAPLYPGQ